MHVPSAGVLFDPVLEDGCFPASSIEQEKRCLTELIEAEQNDKRTYARNRCEQIMCESEGTGSISTAPCKRWPP